MKFSAITWREVVTLGLRRYYKHYCEDRGQKYGKDKGLFAERRLPACSCSGIGSRGPGCQAGSAAVPASVSEESPVPPDRRSISTESNSSGPHAPPTANSDSPQQLSVKRQRCCRRSASCRHTNFCQLRPYTSPTPAANFAICSHRLCSSNQTQLQQQSSQIEHNHIAIYCQHELIAQLTRKLSDL